jgi:hypothetical protein
LRGAYGLLGLKADRGTSSEKSDCCCAADDGEAISVDRLIHPDFAPLVLLGPFTA